MPKRKMGAFFRKAREARGLSQEAAGAESKIDCSSISLYENGINEPQFRYAVILCDVYGADIEALADLVREKSAATANMLRDVRPWKKLKQRKARVKILQPTMSTLFREAREAIGLSLREAGEESKINHISIYRYENDRAMPLFRAAVTLCDFYGIEVKVLADLVRKKNRTIFKKRRQRKKPETG